MIPEWALSKSWAKRTDEIEDNYTFRITRMLADRRIDIKTRGYPLVRKDFDGNTSLHWTKEDGFAESIRKSPLYPKGVCPYCINPITGGGLARTLNFDNADNTVFPEGYFDKGGVYVKCPCYKLRKEDHSLAAKKKDKRISGDI